MFPDDLVSIQKASELSPHECTDSEIKKGRIVWLIIQIAQFSYAITNYTINYMSTIREWLVLLQVRVWPVIARVIASAIRPYEYQ